MNRITLIFTLLAIPTLVACGRPVSMNTPDGFARLGDHKDYDYRAANAQGVVLAVRREANKPRGDLAFWSGALDAHLRRAGYSAVSASDIKTDRGVSGRQIRYLVVRNKREHAFWVTVFVVGDSVVTVEVGGDQEFFSAVEQPISAAILSLDV